LKKYIISLILILIIPLISFGCSSSSATMTTTTATTAITTQKSTTTTSTTVITTQTSSTMTSTTIVSKPTTTYQTVTQTTVTTQTTPTVQKAWHLSEVQLWDNYKGVKVPYHISWTGKEGDIISTVTMDSPYNPISSINAKWTIPMATLVPGTEYQMEFSVTAVNQHTATLGLEGSITAGLDVFNVLPDGATGSRIRIIPEDQVPKIRWNDIDGTLKSGKFNFKAPEYGFADSKNTNKMTLTVKYYSSAILAWRYVYEWTDKDITPVRTSSTTTTP
jgi:hypothetical protein